MRYPGGLRIINHQTVEIHPCFLKELNFAEVSHRLPDGWVRVSWKRAGEEILLSVECPAAVAGTIRLEEPWTLAESGDRYAQAKTGTYRLRHNP